MGKEQVYIRACIERSFSHLLVLRAQTWCLQVMFLVLLDLFIPTAHEPLWKPFFASLRCTAWVLHCAEKRTFSLWAYLTVFLAILITVENEPEFCWQPTKGSSSLSWMAMAIVKHIVTCTWSYLSQCPMVSFNETGFHLLVFFMLLLSIANSLCNNSQTALDLIILNDFVLPVNFIFSLFISFSRSFMNRSVHFQVLNDLPSEALISATEICLLKKHYRIQ